MKKIFLFCGILAVALLAGCDFAPSADEQVQTKQEAMQKQAVAQTGMPGITNFTELKMMRHLYELRDQAITTYTYVPDMNGRLWHLCDSIGFGLPYATQFSNPEKRYPNSTYTQSGYTIPQSEPNGLFMPANAEGTWVMCGSKAGTQPVYIEPRIIVSPIPLHATGEYAEPTPTRP